MVAPVNTRDVLLQAALVRTTKDFLSMEEKPSFVTNYEAIKNTKLVYDKLAIKYNITTLKTAYDDKYVAFMTFVDTLTTPVLWSNLTNITMVVRETLNLRLNELAIADKTLRLHIEGITDSEILLSIPAISVVADSSGAVAGGTLAAVQGNFIVKSGQTNITTGYGVVYSVVSESGCTISLNTSTGQYTPTAMSVDYASAVLRATLPADYGSISVDKTFNINKVKTGATGVSNAILYAYKRVTAGAAAPTDNPGAVTVSLDGSSTSGTIISPSGDALANGWTKTIPSGSGDLYATVATASSASTSDNIAANEWATPNLLGVAGISGLATATIYLYRRSASSTLPSVPQTTTTYTFSSAILSGLSGDGLNWTQTVPNISGGQYLFVTTATAASSTSMDNILSSEWAAVQIMAQNGATGASGTDGNKNAVAYLYQWASSQPGNPSGTSVFTWSTADSSSYTGGNSWQTSIPSNPGTPLLNLWVCSKAVVDVAGATTTSISWSSGYSIKSYAQNGNTGAPGTQAASAKVYKWAVTIPSSPVGSPTYTWATQSFGAAPSGWYLSSTADPNYTLAGYTLWEAKVNITDTAANSTTTFNWTSASIGAIGYNGNTGATGTTGLSYVTAYCASTTATTTTTPASTTGSNSVPATNDGGIVGAWSKTVPSLTSGQYMYQTDGIYNTATNTVSWSIPYWSSLKVGSLSAITTNTGNLNVTGTITVNTGAISGSQMTGSGAQINADGTFALGNSNTDGSLNGGSIVYDGTNMYMHGRIKSNSTYGIRFLNPGASANNYTTVSGPDYIASFTRGSSTLLPAMYINDTSAYSNATIYVLSNVTGSAVSLNNTSSSGTAFALYAESSGTGSGSAKFRNANTSKELWAAPGSYCVFSPSGGGQSKFTDGTAPFTGIHEALIKTTESAEVGDILVDSILINARDVSNTIFEVENSTSSNQRGVIGIYNSIVEFEKMNPASMWETVVGYNEDGTQSTDLKLIDGFDLYTMQSMYKVVSVNALGEGQINVCGLNGSIAKGDLIVTSHMAGKGMRQGDDLIRSYTVAKSRVNVSFEYPEQVKLIPCIYLCG